MKRRGFVWDYFTQISDGASSDSAVDGNDGDSVIARAIAPVDRTDVPVNESYRDAVERIMRDDDGTHGHPRPRTKVVAYACNRCAYRCSGANTSNPTKHLKNHHPVQYEELKRKERTKISEDIDAAVAACRDQSLSAKNRDRLLKKGSRAMKKMTMDVANGRIVDDLQQAPEIRIDLEENVFDWGAFPNLHLPETGTIYTTAMERLEHIRCSPDVETHMWWFLQVSSDATRLISHAKKVGAEKILGENDANVHYVFRRIHQYMEKLDAPQTWRPWYTDVCAEIFKNASNPCSAEEAEVRKLEAYNRECAVLTYFGHIASRVFEYELIFLGGRGVATVWYKFIEPQTLLISNYGCDTRRELHAYCLHYLVTSVATRMGCTQIHWLVRDHLVPAVEAYRLALQAEPSDTLLEFYYSIGCIARSVRYKAFASLVTAYRPLSQIFLEYP